MLPTTDSQQHLLHLRQQIRDGVLTGPTTGLAPDYVQANLMILPQALADEFLLFCQRNPKPCPLIYVSEPGQTLLEAVGQGLDIRTDVPRYRVWRHGQLHAEVDDVTPYWRDDLVSFLIGCSFSFEHALLAYGLSLRQIDEGVNVPMYKTNIPTLPTTRLSGPMVVSMRPFVAADAIRAMQLTSRFPAVHGAPVHLGNPELIGLQDLKQPEYENELKVHPNDIPVFWACGVTPQAVIETVQPAFSITHAPGHMLITDLLNTQLATL